MSLSPYVSERTKRRQLVRRVELVEEIMNQLKTDAYVNVEHIPSCSNTDVNDVSRFRNSIDTVSQRVLESVDDELHRQFDEDTWSICFQNSEEEVGF